MKMKAKTQNTLVIVHKPTVIVDKALDKKKFEFVSQKDLTAFNINL